MQVTKMVSRPLQAIQYAAIILATFGLLWVSPAGAVDSGRPPIHADCAAGLPCLDTYFSVPSENRTSVEIAPVANYKNSPHSTPRVYDALDLLYPTFRPDKSEASSRTPKDCWLCEASYKNPYQHQSHLASLRQGDRLTWTDKTGLHLITLGQFVGAGNSAEMFSVVEYPGWVLRIPMLSGWNLHLGDRWARGHEEVFENYQTYSDTYKIASEPDANFSFPIEAMIPVRFVGPLTMTQLVAPFVRLDHFLKAIRGRDPATWTTEEKNLFSDLAHMLGYLRGKNGLNDIRAAQIVHVPGDIGGASAGEVSGKTSPSSSSWKIFDWTTRGRPAFRVEEYSASYDRLFDDIVFMIGRDRYFQLMAESLKK